MKRFLAWVILFVLSATSAAVAQDTSTEQRLNELSGRIEQIMATQEVQRKNIDQLAKEIRALQDQQNSPKPDYASNEDVKRLAENVREIDRKRMDDYEKIRAELLKLGKTLSAAAAVPPPIQRKASEHQKETKPENGFEYTVQRNDTLSAIVQACRDKNIKVTRDQIIKANPTMKPERLLVGQKIFIPAP